MKKLIIAICSLLLIFLSCRKEFPVQPRANQPPKTFLWLFPDSTIAPGVSKQRIHWWGEDPDGIVVGYLLAIAKLKTPVKGIPKPDTIGWTWTTRNDTLLSFPLVTVRDTFTVFVRAVDNTLGASLLEGSRIRFTPSPYWDKNDNGIFDSTDQPLPLLLSAVDTGAAKLGMPIRNSPPKVDFVNDPNDPTKKLQQPETTFTAATFAWVGSDLDGDETITHYRIALNNPLDSSRWVSLPRSDTLITLFVPRGRSDGATGEVSADVYSGNFLSFFSRPPIRTLPGLKLDGLNTVYVQAKDVAGEYSPMIQMPDTSRRWFVRKPRSRLLVVSDYLTGVIGTASDVRNFYRSTFSQVTLSTGTLGNYDELDIARGVDANAKLAAAQGTVNPQFGVLVPKFLDPAFVLTLFLYDYVFWYTDLYPTLPVAQFSLYYYKNSTFDRQRGRVIFSTAFGTNPDPRRVLPDFAPIDSVSSVDLSPSHLIPTLGDSRIPGGYQLIPDSSDISNIYPTLAFTGTTGTIHSVFMRPVYKQPDGRYIYRMLEDTRVPVRYTYLITTNELRSISVSSGVAHVVGNQGTILFSSDGGNSWFFQSSGVDRILRSIHFIDANQGWIVGDAGTILTTSSSGGSWTNRSFVTVQNLLSVQFVNAQEGLVVGTRGLIIKTTDGGLSWNSLTSGVNLNLRAVHYIDKTTAIAVGDSLTIFRTTDGGTSWRNRRPAGLPSTILGRSLLAVYFSSPTIGFTVGEAGMFFKSTDGGETWTRQTSFTGGELRSIYFVDQAIGWSAGKSGVIFKTTNSGASWGALSSGTNQDLNSAAFSNTSQGIVVASGGVILITRDGGTSWSFQPKGPLNVGVIDGAKRFVFLGLPLHLLNGQNTVKNFLQHVFRDEFGP